MKRKQPVKSKPRVWPHSTNTKRRSVCVIWKTKRRRKNKSSRCVTNIWKSQKMRCCRWKWRPSRSEREAVVVDATTMYPIRVAVMGRATIMPSDPRSEPKRIRPDGSVRRSVANTITIVIAMDRPARNEDARRRTKHRSGRRSRRDSHRSKPIVLYRRLPFRPVNRTAMAVAS